MAALTDEIRQHPKRYLANIFRSIHLIASSEVKACLSSLYQRDSVLIVCCAAFPTQLTPLAGSCERLHGHLTGTGGAEHIHPRSGCLKIHNAQLSGVSSPPSPSIQYIFSYLTLQTVHASWQTRRARCRIRSFKSHAWTPKSSIAFIKSSYTHRSSVRQICSSTYSTSTVYDYSSQQPRLYTLCPQFK